MKRISSLLLVLPLVFSLSAFAMGKKKDQEQGKTDDQTQTTKDEKTGAGMPAEESQEPGVVAQPSPTPTADRYGSGQ